MSETAEPSALTRRLLKQLAHPLKLRLVLTLAAMVAWQLALFGPIGEQVAATTARADRERKRSATAREVEQLKKSLSPYAKLVSPSDDVHDLMQHMIAHIRSSPLRLLDLKPEKPAELGPFGVIGLQLNLEGSYADIDEFLGWIEANKMGLAVEALRLAPITKEPGRLTAQITLKALAERSASPAKAKTEAKKKP